MGRPLKNGLPWVRLDCDYFDGHLMEALFAGAESEEAGELAACRALRILLHIYNTNGFYLEYSADTPRTLAKKVFYNVTLTDAIKKLLVRLVEIGYFAEVTDGGKVWLTHWKIYADWLDAVKKARRTVNSDVLPEAVVRYCVDEMKKAKKDGIRINSAETGVFAEETGVFAEETPENSAESLQSRVEVLKQTNKQTKSAEKIHEETPAGSTGPGPESIRIPPDCGCEAARAISGSRPLRAVASAAVDGTTPPEPTSPPDCDIIPDGSVAAKPRRAVFGSQPLAGVGEIGSQPSAVAQADATAKPGANNREPRLWAAVAGAGASANELTPIIANPGSGSGVLPGQPPTSGSAAVDPSPGVIANPGSGDRRAEVRLKIVRAIYEVGLSADLVDAMTHAAMNRWINVPQVEAWRRKAREETELYRASKGRAGKAKAWAVYRPLLEAVYQAHGEILPPCSAKRKEPPPIPAGAGADGATDAGRRVR